MNPKLRLIPAQRRIPIVEQVLNWQLEANIVLRARPRPRRLSSVVRRPVSHAAPGARLYFIKP